VSPRAALAEALLATLSTPATWPLALAAFLLRGGLLLVLLPIVVLPSPVSLGNVLGPALTTVVLSGVPVELAILVGAMGLAAIVWVLGGGLVAAALEAEGARIVAGRDDGPQRGTASERGISGQVALRIFAARLVAHVPTSAAFVWAAARLVSVAYRELTSPSDIVSPIVWRVLRGAPEVIVVLGIIWMAGEIVGGLAARRIALGGVDVPRALGQAVVAMIRRPLVALVGFWVPAIVLALVLLPSASAAALAWGAVRVAMGTSSNPIGSMLAVLVFVVLWTVGLLLIAVTTAWRAAVWSVAARSLASTGGA
jgi:hypothetical protein